MYLFCIFGSYVYDMFSACVCVWCRFVRRSLLRMTMWAYDITGQEKMMFEGDESPTILSLTRRGISSSPGISVRIHPILRILRQCDDSEENEEGECRETAR